MTALARRMMKELAKRPDRDASIDRKGDILIRCFSPDHKGGQESNASLRIQTEGKFAGNFICRTCGFHGNWNDVSKALKLEEIDLAEIEDLSIFSRQEIDEESIEGSEDKPSYYQKKEYEHPWYADTEWRSIRGKTVRRLGGLLVMDRRANGLLRFPVTYHGIRKAHVDCLIDKGNKKLGYWNSPGPWSETYILFFDYVYKQLRKGKRRSVFIVEGPRDAANVIQYGGLCVPLLGSSNISEKKLEMLLELDAEQYVHMYDGDAAGDKAKAIMTGEYVVKGIQTPFVERSNSKFVKLPRDTDPCNTPPRIIKKLIKFYE